MRESRFHSFLQKLDDVQPRSQPQDADRCLCGLRYVEKIVEQRLVVMSTEEFEVFDYENQSLSVSAGFQASQQER